jgi:Peptidase family M48
MRVSGSQSTKIVLPALLAMATLCLQAQQTTGTGSAPSPQTTTQQSQPPAAAPAAQGTDQSEGPVTAPDPAPEPAPSPSAPAAGPPAQSAPAASPTADSKPAPADQTSSTTDSSNNKGKHGKNKKDPSNAPSAPTASALEALPPATIKAQKNEAPQPGPDGTMPGVKKGSIDDVNAVGTREIGGRGLGNWYSTETEIKEGKSFSLEIEKSVKFINDPVVTEYVNRIGQNIVKNSDAKVPFTIKVIDSDEINAMALPGGFFYVNSGLILAADNEAEMAGVMAHEIAHVAAHHAVREQTRLNYAQFGTIPLIFVGGGLGYGIYEAASVGIPITFLQFSRDFERQADFLGLQYMYRSGYDPQAFAAFFEKIQNLEKTKPGLVAKTFSDHPQTPDRIEATQTEIAHLLPPKDEYVITTSEFDDVKARLARIENKRKLRDGQNEKKPTLRRASTTPDANGQNPNGQTTSDDDRPTLHRRDN